MRYIEFASLTFFEPLRHKDTKEHEGSRFARLRNLKREGAKARSNAKTVLKHKVVYYKILLNFYLLK